MATSTVERTIRINELNTTIMYGLTSGSHVSHAVIEAPRDATFEEVREAMTLRRMECWHEHDCCGCVTRQTVLRLDRGDSLVWNVIVEVDTNV